jgi:hypothetical protein
VMHEYKNDDDGWRAEAHKWPFALNFRRGGQGVLHVPEGCHHIYRQTPASRSDGGLTTYRAKYAFDDRAEAVAFCVQKTGVLPVRCKTCNP